jgi:hypothetical protein
VRVWRQWAAAFDQSMCMLHVCVWLWRGVRQVAGLLFNDANDGLSSKVRRSDRA